MAVSPCLGGEKKHWWLHNRKITRKYIREAKHLMATQDPSDLSEALSLIDAAIAASPSLEPALELRARCLLQLRRFRDVADMLQDYIPSLRLVRSGGGGNGNDYSGSVSSDNSSSQKLSRERVKLLKTSSSSGSASPPTFKCFSAVSDLKKKVMAGLCKSCDKEGRWRYTVLGEACCHLGLMEDAMVLLQTGKRLASAAFRRESICRSDDSFSFSSLPISGDLVTTSPSNHRSAAEFESATHLLALVKLLIRRRTAALAALDAGLHSEAIRHFSKILDGRSFAPRVFLAECYMGRAAAYRAAGRVAESIADCNKTLALDPTSIHALETRAALLEWIRCLPDCLHDLEHLKLLYNSILRDRKLPGPRWKRHYVQYREVPGRLCALTVKVQELKKRVASGEIGSNNVDYYLLMGLRRGCTRSELERAHLLLTLRHKPDKAMMFMERCEFYDHRDLDSVRDRARMSAMLLYRLIQKGYGSVMANVLDEEAAEKQRKKAAAVVQTHQVQESEDIKSLAPAAVFQGVFCRDLAAVSNLLSQVGFNQPMALKYEALSC
ncbi:hypothetical protein SAY87_025213 [Trapa incisa]|uniref:J domain-containing protein n=1 Tax=Trapa incisa TaxID=236973 RepID=A0AAN7JGD3_9MYRT|nr:hypothetical protein SAY87_025213 [Trapa incisa]